MTVGMLLWNGGTSGALTTRRSVSSIDAFIGKHAPLPGHVALSDAPFWSPAQSAFLCSELAQDADWAEVVDALNVALRLA